MWHILFIADARLFSRDNAQHMFDCFCEVVIPTKADEKPWIVQKFPDSYQNEETLKMVPQFTFPCDFER